jgi:hypothetical protein
LIRNIPPYSRVGLATPDFQLHITGQGDPALIIKRKGAQERRAAAVQG